MKKIISLVLAILMIISAMTALSYAEDKQSYVDKLDFSEKFFTSTITILFTPVVKQADTTEDSYKTLGYATYTEANDYVVKLLDELGVDIYHNEKRLKGESVHLGWYFAVEDNSDESICGYNFLSAIDVSLYESVPNGTNIYPVAYVEINNIGDSVQKVIAEVKKFDGCDKICSVTPSYEKQHFVSEGTIGGDTIPTPWYLEPVQYCLSYDLMSGMKPATENLSYMSTFEPETAVTRAMAVKTLHNIEGMPKATADAPVFSDAASGWYADAVKWASEKEITNGISKDLFAPGKTITREQFAVFLYRYAALKGYDTKGKSDLSKFNDNTDVSDYAKAALEWANHEEYITGMGNGMLAPQGQLTRAQLASILMRFTKAHKE